MGIPAVIVDQHKRTHARHAESVRLAFESGVPIVAGGDAGLTHFPQGSCAEEAVSYVEIIGMSSRDSLRTLTVNVARLLGILDDVGTVDVGKRADLLVIDGNPLDDVSLLQRADLRRFVLLDGDVVAGTETIH